MKKINFKELIVFENDNYVVINKPPFISTLEDRVDQYNILALAKKEDPEFQVCHRLDKETSGALVLAKNPEAYRNMAMQLEARKVEKIYHAISHGIHDVDGLSVEVSLTLPRKGIVRIESSGKPAKTLIKTGRAYKFHTLMICKPITGRTHQIRVHLAYLKAPIVNDDTYGGKDIFLSDIKRKFNLSKEVDEQPLIKRVALHAFSIKFNDVNGKELNIEAPYPKDFSVLVKQLEKNA